MAFMMIFLLHATAYMPDGWEHMPYSWMIYTPAWAGTWIFFVLAGYGVGATFCSGKYDPLVGKDTPILKTGIARFYIRRLSVILPLYWLWILCVAIFVQSDILRPGPTHIKMLIRLFLFDYQEEFYQETFGVAWYITTLMRLYLIAPLICYLMKHFIKTKKQLITVLTTIMLIFLGIRLVMLHFYRVNPPDMWSVEVYKPFWFNMDLFSCGMLLNLTKDGQLWKRTPSERINKLIGVSSFCTITGLSVFTSYHYYLADRVYQTTTVFMDIYRYILPSIHMILCLVFIYCVDIGRGYTQTRLTSDQVIKNPIRLFDCFRVIQYPMYLFHTTVMYCLKEVYIPGMYDGSLRLIGGRDNTLVWAQNILFLVYTFALSIVMSASILIIRKNQ